MLLASAVCHKSRRIAFDPLHPRVLAPLLEQERGPGRVALVAQATCPVGMHRARLRPALATHDDPIDQRSSHIGRQQRLRLHAALGACSFSFGVASMGPGPPAVRWPEMIANIDRAEQRLDRKKGDPQASVVFGLPELDDVALGFLLVDDSSAQPDVLGKAAGSFGHAMRVADTLRDEQPIEVRRFADQREQLRTPFGRYLVIEHVGEAGAEYALADAGSGGFAVPSPRLLPRRRSRVPARCAWAPLNGETRGR